MRLTLPALVLLAACAPPAARQASVVPDAPPSRVDAQPSDRATSPVEVYGCPMRQPPEQPTVQWLAPGCPPQFLSCMNGEDSAKVMRYLKAIRAWAREVYQRCGRVE